MRAICDVCGETGETSEKAIDGDLVQVCEKCIAAFRGTFGPKSLALLTAQQARVVFARMRRLLEAEKP